MRPRALDPPRWLKIEGPETLRFLDNKTRIDSPETYLAWHAERLLDRGLVAARTIQVHRLRARINHGRFLADCLSCGSGMFTRPDWRLACCAECGAVYNGVIFPERIAAIVLLLLARPRRENQNWERESVWKLTLENRLHGCAT